ncbi:MAG: GNAT family N-acetyltransferase [Niastella sp.]|nr:GNAT family N-acetyltransferase [Niastella sp.]
MHIVFQIKHFNELSLTGLYTLLQLRSKVFVVEQDCVYLDADDKDQDAYHVCGYQNDELIAYARLLKPGVRYKEASIGRVISHPGYRRFGAGKLLMQKSIEQCQLLFKTSEIKIGAQVYLLQFYENLGFIPSSPPYLEDGIPHLEMIYQP